VPSASIPHRHLTRLTFAFLAALAAGTARAAVPTAAIRYVAPPGCPGPFKFLSLVEERTAGRWQVRQGDGDSDFVVEIRDGANGKVGRVRRADRAADGAREIASADCGDLVEALALSTVLSLDDSAGKTRAGPLTVVTAPALQPVPRSSWIVGGGASNTFLLPSDAMLGVSIFVENGRRLWPVGLGIRRPDLRLALTHARNDLLGGDRARFTLSDATLTVCPMGAGFGATVSLGICGIAEAGMLSGEGIAVGTPRTSRFLWAAGGGVVRLRWAPGRRTVVEAHAGGVAPLERTTFIFEMPRVEVARVPAFVASAGFTVGWAIP
jgi:hypothetical protein